MSEHLINYDAMVQDALLGVIRKLLEEAAINGLPGEHHFYVAFDTTAPGVTIPGYLREQHPNEMTIVLQHQFWGLTVSEESFSVQLSFHGKPETLIIPFKALTGFLDPSVQFGFQFGDQSKVTRALGDSGQPTVQSAVSPSAEKDVSEEAGENVVTLDTFRKS